MKKPIPNKLWPGILAALSVGAFSASAQEARLIAHWDFERVEADGVTIRASTGNYAGEISGEAVLTDPTGGRPMGGGRGFDGSQANPGWLLIQAEGDENPMTAAAADDSMTIVLWQKNISNINSSSFWAIGEGFDRAFQFHIPWSDGTIYFDTAGGCCAAPAQRLNANVQANFPDHDWEAWHHYAFIKDGGYKAIYVDGNLLIEQEDGADPLPTEYTQTTIGGANNASPPDAVIDDFAIFKGRLTEEKIKELAAGASPGVPPVDTDGDGMPDFWEILYGFDINDPSDADEDCDGDGATNLEEYLAGTDPCDTTPPTVVSAAATAAFDTVVVTFSEPVDPVTAVNLANYTITPSLQILSASVSKGVVTLTTAPQTPGGTAYTLTVKDVLDTSKNPVPENSSVTFYSYLQVTEGVLRISAWFGITGTAVDNLYFDERYPSSPDVVGAVFSFNSRDFFPNDARDNYGAVIEGFITPEESGDYHFFLRSDDASELYISTNESDANLFLQATETGCCAAFQEIDLGAEETTAFPISMVAGSRYYIRVVYKEGGGGDYAQVAWRKVGDPTPAASLQPIPGRFLSSPSPLPAPPEGAFTAVVPANNARNVSPATAISISHRDGKTPWTAENVTMQFNGAPVTPTFSKVGNVLTVSYVPAALLASASVNTVTLSYPDPGANPASSTFTFTVLPYSGETRDAVGGYPGLLQGSSQYTADGGGHTGQAGDRGIDLTLRGGPVATYDRTFLAAVNAAMAEDELSVSFWQKKLNVNDSSAFTVNSPGSPNNRAFHAHVPWSNQTIYFDTVGCCDEFTQRILSPIDTFPGYTGDATWWTDNWNHFVFTKKGSSKYIFINGQYFFNGDSTAALPTDANAFFMGSGANATELSAAIIDDFAVFGKELVEADALAIFNGTLPTALPAAKGLIAYWNFNEAAVALPTISISGSVITYTGTLKASSTLGGTYTAVFEASSPYTIPLNADAQFYLSEQ